AAPEGRLGGGSAGRGKPERSQREEREEREPAHGRDASMRLVSSPPTRRAFLHASAAAAVAAWISRPANAGAAPLGTVPFADEGVFPVDETVGAGLGRRRALDLSTLAPDGLAVPQDRFFIRTGCPDPLPSTSTWKVRGRGLVETPADLEVAALQR